MDIDDILTTGSRIVDSVEQHISTGDFSGLSKEIRDIAGGAPYSSSFQEMAQQINAQNRAEQKRGVQYPATFNEKAFSKTKETLKKGVFLLLTVVFFIAAAIFIAAGATGSALCVIFGIICLILAIYCIYNVRKINRMKAAYAYLPGYAIVIGDRVWYDVAALARENNQETEEAIKTIRTLIQIGCLPRAKLSTDNKTLFLTGEAYRSYTQDQTKKRREEQKTKEKTESLSPQVQDLIREGEHYVARIRAYNEAIPEKEFSAQLDRLEACTRNVFELVREDPSNAQSLRRMMDYYLPTIDKMLAAYVDLEKRRIPGNPNTEISETQHEIEDATDTINTAFEKLLNDMIRSRSWDVRSDISAMETMMKQDGLV